MQRTLAIPARRRSAFTLIEMLVVMVIIGVVLTLTLAPFDRLITVAGVDGGASMIATQLRACRQHAISQRSRVALLVFRSGATQGIRTAQLDRNNAFVQWTPNSSWIYLPTAAVVERGDNTVGVAVPAAEMEPAASVDTTLPAIVFIPSGKLAGQHPPGVSLRISDALWDGADYQARGDGNNWQQISVNRFTGRVEITGP